MFVELPNQHLKTLTEPLSVMFNLSLCHVYLDGVFSIQCNYYPLATLDLLSLVTTLHIAPGCMCGVSLIPYFAFHPAHHIWQWCF